jgi:hypothetical protein
MATQIEYYPDNQQHETPPVESAVCIHTDRVRAGSVGHQEETQQGPDVRLESSGGIRKQPHEHQRYARRNKNDEYQ